MTPIKRYEIEAEEKWDTIRTLIPFIPFPNGWQIKMLPPFGGAVARFAVTVEGINGAVSIYLDWYDRLGYYGSPYWEVWPVDGDVGRCGINEIDELLTLIKTSLEGFKKEKQK